MVGRPKEGQQGSPLPYHVRVLPVPESIQLQTNHPGGELLLQTNCQLLIARLCPKLVKERFLLSLSLSYITIIWWLYSFHTADSKLFTCDFWLCNASQMFSTRSQLTFLLVLDHINWNSFCIHVLYITWFQKFFNCRSNKSVCSIAKTSLLLMDETGLAILICFWQYLALEVTTFYLPIWVSTISVSYQLICPNESALLINYKIISKTASCVKWK